LTTLLRLDSQSPLWITCFASHCAVKISIAVW